MIGVIFTKSPESESSRPPDTGRREIGNTLFFHDAGHFPVRGVVAVEQMMCLFGEGLSEIIGVQCFHVGILVGEAHGVGTVAAVKGLRAVGGRLFSFADGLSAAPGQPGKRRFGYYYQIVYFLYDTY